MDEKLKKALAEVAMSYDPEGRNGAPNRAFAEMVIESINPNHLTLDIFNTFLRVRSGTPGTQYVKRVRSGHRVYSFVPGTMHRTSQIAVRDIMAYQYDSIIAGVRMNEWELRRGELGSIDAIRSELEAELVDATVARVYRMIADIWDGTTSNTNYFDASSTGLTETILDNMVETVLRYAGNIRAIVGTRQALQKVYSFAGVQEVTPVVNTNTNGVIGIQAILEEYRRNGRLTSYKGNTLVELGQVYKHELGGFDTPLLEDDKVLVIGDNAGEILLYDGIESWDHRDTTVQPPAYQLHLMKQFGMMIDRAENIGIIKVPSPTYQYHIP